MSEERGGCGAALISLGDEMEPRHPINVESLMPLPVLLGQPHCRRRGEGEEGTTGADCAISQADGETAEVQQNTSDPFTTFPNCQIGATDCIWSLAIGFQKQIRGIVPPIW